MKHPKEIKGYEDMSELATDISNLRYDKLSELLEKLSQTILSDAAYDFARRRPYLSSELYCAGTELERAAKDIDKAWYYCKRNMDDEDCI